MDNRADNKGSTASPRIKLGTTLGDADGRTVGSQMSGPPKVVLDNSRVLGDSAEGRTVGGKKSGLIGKVHVDPSRVMATPGEGKTRSGGAE